MIERELPEWNEWTKYIKCSVYIHSKRITNFLKKKKGAKQLFENSRNCTRVNLEQQTPRFTKLTSSMLWDEELMMWHCFNQFQNFFANQGLLWCKLRGLNALLISKCCTACYPRSLASASCISNCCTACYSCGLVSASPISNCCITCYLCGLVYAALLILLFIFCTSYMMMLGMFPNVDFELNFLFTQKKKKKKKRRGPQSLSIGYKGQFSFIW